MQSLSKKPKWLIIASNVRHNFAAKLNQARGKVESDIGSTHQHLSIAQSLAYINRVFDDYFNYGEISRDDLHGKRILELGPGDNLGVALRLYSAGASQVVCLDKFYSNRNAEQQVAIYRALREGLSPMEQARYDQAIDLNHGGTLNPNCIQYIYGVSAEEADERLGKQSFDMVISRAVIWEIYDTDGALRALDQVLRPGGMMIHKIACLDWMFRKNGYHPLEFLTIPEWLYKWVARDSGKSNRRTIGYYKKAMHLMGYDSKFHVTRITGAEGEDFKPGVTSLEEGVHYTQNDLKLLAEIRPRLIPKFQKLPNEDLLVEDMFLVSVKAPTSSRSIVHPVKE